MKKIEISKWFTRLVALTLLSGVFVLSGCGDDDDDEPEVTQNVWQIVQNDARLSDLEAELLAAGLDGALANTPNITLFAPSNDALATLLNTLGIDDFSPVRDDIAQAVLSYHVAASVIMSSDLSVGQTITTLVPNELITVGAGPVLESGATSDAEFIETDIEATNGVVHVIDVVLVPPSIGALIVQTLGTVAQPILLAADFSTLAAAIQKADAGKAPAETILGAMVSLDDITVFAPVNAVFEGAGIGLDDFTAEEWDAIIRGHAVAATLAPLADQADIQTVNPGVTVTTAAAPAGGGFGTVQGSGNATAINILADGVPAGNGVVYPLGGVIN